MSHQPFTRRFERDELARIYGDVDHADALNDNHPADPGNARLLAASTWLSIILAVFICLYFVAQAVRVLVS